MTPSMAGQAKAKTKRAAKAAPVETVVAFKGFDAGLACTGGRNPFQYEVGKTYEHKGSVVACQSGFHACENPWDVLSYYPLIGNAGSLNRFAKVTLSGEIARHGSDSKIAGGRITIDLELGLPVFIQAGVDWLIAATKLAAKSKGLLTDKGEDDARIGSSGNDAQIGSSGNGAQIDASGERAVIASAGIETRAKGADGARLSLAEFEYRDGEYHCVGFATGQIGKGGLKADTFYRAEGGKLVVA